MDSDLFIEPLVFYAWRGLSADEDAKSEWKIRPPTS